jgi:two-component system response regulator MprA
MRVLIVEDEKRMADLLKAGLEEEQHTVMVAYDGRDGLELALQEVCDVLVLDVLLPGLSGFEIARRLREKGNRTPILMLTARDAVTDVVKGLDLGADDYLTKPFSFEEFSARVRAVARRGPISQAPQLRVADLVLDPATHEVFRSGRGIPLTRKEYQILELLMRHHGRVLSRSTILESVWGVEREVENNTLDAFIKKLRQKVDAGETKRLIHTIRGVGYSCREKFHS